MKNRDSVFYHRDWNLGRFLPDVTGVELAKEMCNAEVRGANIGSTRLEYRPGPLNKYKREFVADTQTAGCLCLLAQVALPCALFIPCDDNVAFILKGGTNVPMGPQVEYLEKVFQPMLNRFGGKFYIKISRRWGTFNLSHLSMNYLLCIISHTKINNK